MIANPVMTTCNEVDQNQKPIKYGNHNEKGIESTP